MEVGRIFSTRGIQQGDPISPYFFLICAEVLSSLLQHAKRTSSIYGVPASKRWPKHSHLFFTDDNLLFSKANSVEWRRVMRQLEKYESASS